ncbi:MAG: sodium-dependent transporter [Lachnospiraceae bacterium]|nr:sodium-dependent transporter [Lachnospiraceae bacterium]
MNNENNQENNLDPFGRDNERSSFSGKLGYVLAVAGSAVGLGNIWRFPYLAAKYGGGIFLLVYLILMLTFGYVLIVSETTLGRLTRKSPVGAFNAFGKSLPFKIGGWINAVIPMLIIPYYSVIGGWVFKYLFEYLRGSTDALAEDSYFTGFITAGASVEVWFLIFTLVVLLIIVAGVEHGIEKVSKMMMPVLVILAVVVSIYSVTRPGALEGVKYFLIPNFDNFSWMTIVAAMGQMFYSLSIAMGILYTYGSYMKKDVDIEQSTSQIEVFDTAIAFLAGLMIIPAVFSFFNGDPEKLKAGPSLMFITLPKVFASMGMGRIIGIVFFLLVLLAALTSAISLAESCVSTLEDQLGWKRNIASVVIGIVIVVLGSFSALGFGMLDFVQILGMSILDFFDFLTNSLMMPIAALSTCILIVYVVGVDKIVEEVETSSKFKRKGIYKFFIKYLAPICILIILVSSIASVFGLIKF